MDKKEFEGGIVFYMERPSYVLDECPVIAIKEGHTGYWPIWTRRSYEELNQADMTPEIIEAAFAGSMFGWQCEAAKPAIDYCEKRRAQA